MLPADVFDARTALLVGELGTVEAPPESGERGRGVHGHRLQAANRARQHGRPAHES